MPQGKNGCRGFEINQRVVKRNRFGNFWVDFLGFKKKTDVTITLAVSFRYLSGNAQIIFTQRPLHTVEEYFSVGASANIENVSVHESPGELVSGGWKVLQPVQKVDSTPTVEEAPLQTAWDPDLPQFTLRWQSGDMAYEIRSHSNPEINKEIILKIAESIK